MSEHDMFRPRLGALTVLVYRECECGNWCCTGENSRAPLCPACDGEMIPLGGAIKNGVPMFGDPEGDGHEQMRTRRLGFVGLLTNESAVRSQIGRIRKWLGISEAWMTFDATTPPGGHGPYAAEGEIAQTMEYRRSIAG